MTTRHDTDNAIAAWLQEEGAAGAPERLLTAARDRVRSTQQRRAWIPGRMMVGTYGLASFAFAATAVLIVAVVAIGLWSAGGRLGGVHPVATASPSPGPTPSGDSSRIPGLPPEGTTPSDAEPGELVLQFVGTASGKSIWVYADGRMIWNSFYLVPSGATDAYVGYSEQRLTSSGVDFLRSAADSTGLFESDLMLLREGYAPFLQIKLLKGEGLVTTTWAWRGIAGDAPVPTAAQESALRSLEALLTDSESWPESAWQDATLRAWVPSEYVVCFGVLHRPGDPTPRPLDVMSPLPAPARSLIKLGDRTPQDGMHSDYGCARLTTDDAIAFARILDNAGLQRDRATDYLLYSLSDSGSQQDIRIQFGAVLPGGEAVYLGPG